MRAFLKPNKRTETTASKKIVVFLLVFLILFSFQIQPVRAQIAAVTTEAVSVPQTIKNALDKAGAWLNKILGKAGSLAFNQVLRQALNKIAYDSAVYIGSAGPGQKSLFVTMDWGKYWAQVGDEAAGTFVENFANNLNSQTDCKSQSAACEKKCDGDFVTANKDQVILDGSDTKNYNTCMTACTTKSTSCTSAIGAKAGSTSSSGTMAGSVGASVGAGGNNASFNVCSPSSLEAKIKIGLGLVQVNQPQAPNCTASQMVKNWGAAGDNLYQKLTDYSQPNFLDNFKSYFDPTSNDLGIYMLARTDMANAALTAKANSTAQTTANQGWLDVRNIAKSSTAPPGTGKASVDKANAAQTSNLGKTTGDIFVDAANLFLNQLAMSLFDNLMQNLSKKTGGASSNTPGSASGGNTNDPNVITYGEPQVQEIASKLLQPTFGIQADYDILSQLAICPDPKSPGPTNCVIDNQFMQAATEKTTVAEAITKGYLHGDWQLSAQTANNNYSLRNISILRQYRILPVGWEVAIQKASADPLHPKKVTLNDLVSCFDPNDQYSQFSAGFDVHNQAWCQGLVDPNWVIKAPLNYCARQGAGYLATQPVVSPGVKGVAGTADILSTINVSRASDYCGDQKSCIKENSDGSCSAYGYCNEEERTWTFGNDSCDPIYNTCQTFSNTDGGSAVSYLQNTLDYTGCDSNNAGCRQYSWFGAYSSSTALVAWDNSKSLYLNKKTALCDPQSEGCTSLVRIKPTWGANLVMDSNFSNDDIGASSTGPAETLNDWPHWSSGVDPTTRQATIVDASLEPGGASGKALKLESAGSATGQVVLSTFSNSDHSLTPDNLQTIPGQSYTLSADVYLVSGSHAYLVLGSSTDNTVATSTTLGSWQHMTVTRQAANTYNQPDFDIHADSNNGQPVVFYVQNVKFEMSDWDTGYSPYGYARITEKLVPPYLEKTCYVDATSATKDYRFKNGAPAICSNYARRCNQDEVGCEMYTAVSDGFTVPAKVSNNDYCTDQCLGYDIYISRANYFNSAQAENLIPTTAQTCSAEAAGCSEFTNLDAVSQGGENKEYYSYLKQCIRPSQAACANFYSWAGTESGYQLLAASLKKDASGNPEATPGGAVCDAVQYNLPVSDPNYNPDCQRFYNTDGQPAYRLISHTITCSDNCHTYRMSDTNIDTSVNSSAACATAQGHWDTSQNTCAVCLNGGVWDTNLSACTYQAIPGEGQTCDAAQNGCREYNGPSGSNVRQAATYDFENNLNGWYSNCSGGVKLSNISNNKDGHSLQYVGGVSTCVNIGELNNNQASRQPLIKEILASDNVAAEVNVAGSVTQGAAYNLKFLARAAVDTTLKIYFYNKDNPAGQQAVYFGSATGTLTVKGGSEWQIYQANLDNLTHAVGPNEVLVITANHDFYLDSVILNEISDRYYLIKGSSVIPNSCYYDIYGNYQGADFNLGCAQYTDRDNLKHDLHRFGQLCADSAVGCEQMIDTKNYNFYGAGFWENGSATSTCDSATNPGCLKVAGDSAIYAVYDQSKLCNSADAGCSRLGQKQSTGEWTDTYLKNNPDSYNQILCNAAGVNCSEWSNDSGGFSYFKDPGNNACAYRASTDPTINGKNWYKLPVKRCDINSNGQIDGTEKTGAICQKATDCGGKPCIQDNNDYSCSVSYFKTFGLGGAGNQVPTPDSAAGICSATTAGCTEYIDPVSSFMPNLVYNPNYQVASNGGHEGWGAATNEKWNNQSLNPNQQVITLTPNKLYVFSTISGSSGNPSPVSLEFTAGIRPLLNDNTLGTTTNILTIPVGADKHLIFDSLSNYRILVDGGLSGRTVEVKEAATNYQLQSSIDKTSCNGLVNSDKGCVLFNERSVGSSGLTSLASGWDAYATPFGKTPVPCSSSQAGSCTANQLIKVTPDRVCSKWLDCVTYVQDPITKQQTCYAVGECNRLDDKGECANFDNTPTTVRQFNPSSDKNATGYSLVGDYYFDQMKEVGLNSDAHFDFEDSVPSLSCKKAIGSGTCNFNKNIVKDSLVREPEGAPTDYPAHGKSYLKVPSAYQISPQSGNSKVSLVGDKDYYLNLLINTKNSGVGSRVQIVRADNNAILDSSDDKASNGKASFDDQASNGWERKIYQFHTPAATDSGIKIYLGSDSPDQEGYVYFDDINIEPVLDTGKDASGKETYAARECRLYPADDSLTCVNKNNNVIADGWEGYCLQHDSNNPINCLLWYPVDHIAPAQTNPPVLGYQGSYPLNYCTELNGNFDLVEKRSAKLVANYCAKFSPIHGVECDVKSSDLTAAGYETSWNYYCTHDSALINTNRSADIEKYCGPGSAGKYWLQVFLWPERKSYFCMPSYANPWSGAPSVLIASSSSITIPKCDTESDVVVPVTDGWYKYDGFNNNTNLNEDSYCSAMGAPDRSACHVAYFDEAKNADPPIRVYDYNNPPTEEDNLKLVSGADSEKNYRLTCNRFTQTVDSAGLNYAWAGRISLNSIYPTTTPAYFIKGTFGYYSGLPNSLLTYGRNRESTPFGAATWPDNFDLLSSEPIKFQDQYSKKNNENVFAGRPYGCYNASGSGCSDIGYCSLNPNVFCLLSATPSSSYDIAKKTCGDGGYGQCVPLWNQPLSAVPNNPIPAGDYENILKTIFLKSYGDFHFTDNMYSSESYSYDWTDVTKLGLCQNNIRPSELLFPGGASFCAVRPQVKNVVLKLNDALVGNHNPFNVTTKGIYRLEFNTMVNVEQEPLREIRIDWGDSEPVQVITGQDQHPATSTPHVFYHYYRQPQLNTSITIRAIDNWGRYIDF